MENLETRISTQQAKVKQMEEELKQLLDHHRQIENHNQKVLGNMRNQLNKNIFQTINEYKEYGKSMVKDQSMYQQGPNKSFQSYY